MVIYLLLFFFFFNDTATTEIYTLSLHDALPILWPAVRANLRKERRRRNTFRVGHIQTPQMPSCHNRLLPSALLLPTRRLSRPYSHNRLCLSPSSSSYSSTSLHRFPLFFSPSSCPHRRVRSSFRFIDPFGPLTLLQSPRSDSCKPSSSYINISTFLTPFPIQKSLSLPCSLPQLLFSLSDGSHNGLISPRGCLFK